MSLKKFSVAMVALLAIGGVLANSASATVNTTAAKFFVEGAELTGSKTLTGSAVTNSVFEFEIGSIPIKLQSTAFSCSGCKIENKEVTGKAGKVAFGEGKIVFENVTIAAGSGCTATVKGDTGVVGTVPTKPLFIHGDFMDANTANKHAFLQFFPQTGTTFAQFELLLGTCPPGVYKLTGSVFGEATRNTGEDAVRQELVFSPTVQGTAGGGLGLGTKIANFSGTGAFELSTSQIFNIH
ncbi:MAG TPA: hypothetical protein VGI17_04245 [Solirubrobacterales bacterium]|jgi:hypothetical protein